MVHSVREDNPFQLSNLINANFCLICLHEAAFVVIMLLNKQALEASVAEAAFVSSQELRSWGLCSLLQAEARGVYALRRPSHSGPRLEDHTLSALRYPPGGGGAQKWLWELLSPCLFERKRHKCIWGRGGQRERERIPSSLYVQPGT